MKPKIGILGAGKLGTILAKLFVRSGYEVLIAGSGAPHKKELIISVLAPGAKLAFAEEVANYAEIIILALPLSKLPSIPKEVLSGKLVIDAMNYWWEIDGLDGEFAKWKSHSSEFVQSFLPDSRVVKAFNHMGYHDLDEFPSPRNDPDRRAIALAGDNEDDLIVVSKFIDDIGFDPLPIGALKSGSRLAPGSNAFGANLSIKDLENLVNSP